MESKHHYFASFALGWATAQTRKEAIEKLSNMFRSDMKAITQNIQKDGKPGAYLWSCKVNAPENTKYEINYFAPKGVEIDQGMHHHITYITAKKMAYTSETELATYSKEEH